MADSKSYFNQSQQAIIVVRMDTERAYIWYLTEIAIVKFIEAACFNDCNAETSVLGKSSCYCQSCSATCGYNISAPPDLSRRDGIANDTDLLSRHSRTKH